MIRRSVGIIGEKEYLIKEHDEGTYSRCSLWNRLCCRHASRADHEALTGV